MAKKSAIAKQKQRAEKAARHYEKRQKLKKIVSSPESTEEERHEAMITLNKMSPNGSNVRLKNRCQLTGRPHGFLRKFQISRICLRELAAMGMIPGVTKASW